MSIENEALCIWAIFGLVYAVHCILSVRAAGEFNGKDGPVKVGPKENAIIRIRVWSRHV